MHTHLASLPFHLMRRLFQEHTAQWQKTLPELTKQQYSVLCAVADRPDIEQADLIDVAISTKATLAEMLMRMEKRGLVVRKPGIHDRRRRFITLTAAGEEALNRGRPAANEVDSKFLNRLSGEEQKILVQLLQKMVMKSE
ncbi:MAG: winged helix DNA-binding protein [Rouxiella aceris]|uniref:MarR family winged helix-turn-helix transcriptional regulator n=1 Tax=Rouxiella aceris TaxID=2703884 RepID=UPI00284C0E47|nr:MarR family transcriptional regulator [Rouxiella aceris]MDR3434326.1 winged helix DNA-binding protein [Rouxiella aceris]